MGGVIKGIGGIGGGVPNIPSNITQPVNVQIAALQAQVAHLTKLVHILWGEARQVAEVMHIDHQGVHISAGSAHLKLLRHGTIVLDAPKMQGSGGIKMSMGGLGKGMGEASSA
jgi:hypothetical protein